MERLFFSKENFKIINNILQKKILESLKYDINSNQQFSKELVNIMKTIYKQRNTFNIPADIKDVDYSRFLSQKVINVAFAYFSDSIKKNKTNVNTLEREVNSGIQTSHNKISERPTPSIESGLQSNIQNKYESLMKEREKINPMPTQINFSDDNFQKKSNDDVAKRFSEISNNRNMEYENINKVSTNNTFPNNLTTQQDFIDKPSKNQMESLLEQQKILQQKINSFQKDLSINDSSSMLNVNHPKNENNMVNNVSELSNEYRKLDNNNKKDFLPFTHTNNQFYSESEASSNLIAKQFESINIDSCDEKNDEMAGDSYIDYDDILNDMTNETQVNTQFTNELQNLSSVHNEIENVVPKKMFDNTVTKSNNIMVTSNESNNLELEIIKKNLDNQARTIDESNVKIDKLLKLHQSYDITKFYDTIMDIPSLIEKQKTQPLTIRTHNLIVSSRDRDLTNAEFDKYNFRIVFGAQGSETVNKIVYDDSSANSGLVDTQKYSVNNNTFVSSGLKNPTVQQVLKNVISIKLKRVILPKPRDNNDNYYPEPYYFICVDEFNSNIISTKTFNEKIFCKIHFDKEFSFGTGDDTRKFLYYKNDDDDYTLFYSSPLSKLDRITLKLFTSNGESVRTTFGDNDIFKSTSDYNDTITNVNQDFYNGTFIKDKLYNTTTNQNFRVTETNTNDNNTIISNGNDLSTGENQVIVNLTNQIEYIFEIKTQEPDPTSQIRPSI